MYMGTFILREVMLCRRACIMGGQVLQKWCFRMKLKIFFLVAFHLTSLRLVHFCLKIFLLLSNVLLLGLCNY